MINDLRRPENPPRGPEARPRLAPGRSAYASLIQDLVRFRQLVLERLTSIETLAGEQPAPGTGAPERTAMEEALKIRSDELDAFRRKLEDQAERDKRDWNASLAQLQDDRRLLAEAWEQLEKARIDTVSTPRMDPSRHSLRQNPQTAGSNGWPRIGASIPMRSTEADSDADDPVDQAILRQFQTLYHDVRQSAQGRRTAR